MRVTVIAASFGMAGVLWIGVSAQQEMRPKPEPGSGITRVTGEVRVAPPPFAHKGGSYTITWGDGGTENVILADVGPDGWVRTEGGRPRWINLRLARAVELR